ncbi:MAG: glycoside hydrolase family 15 protein [Gemmatimonadetes bacterium]|nr:glycoside hydrolase family 15 protein [Gemmatimonadota bacterium]
MTARYRRLEDYGVIGDLDTCALVACDGAIDWLCLPHLEGPSVFGAILDAEQGGRFRIAPEGRFGSRQAYLERTNVLCTTFTTSTGTATLTDVMPVRAPSGPGTTTEGWRLLRKLTCTAGWMAIEAVFDPRFDYARRRPLVECDAEGVVARSAAERLFLRASVPFVPLAAGAGSRFELRGGESRWFALHDGAGRPEGDPARCGALLDATARSWREWAHRCDRGACPLDGPWHDLAVRSGLVLKLLTHPESGAIAAAATTSLPEEIGGVRNWDYRFAWIRDAAFTAQALFALGHREEALGYFRFLRQICHSCPGYHEPGDIAVLYGLHGEPGGGERLVEHLEGYRGSRPVRVGNAAATQRQLDIYGELANSMYQSCCRRGEPFSPLDWRFIRSVADYVCDVWDTPDRGIWEVRGPDRHFTHSKLMCWVALDRAIRMAGERALGAPPARWRRARRAIRDAILTRGFSRRLNSFVQAFDSAQLDAATLLIPRYGFLPGDDPRVLGTIEAVSRGLTADGGLVYRYQADDGLPGGEGAFVLCSFWLVDALALSGQRDRAEELFVSVLRHASPLGLFAEEIDPASGELRGNFPQAFSHIGVINSALCLTSPASV